MFAAVKPFFRLTKLHFIDMSRKTRRKYNAAVTCLRCLSNKKHCHILLTTRKKICKKTLEYITPPPVASVRVEELITFILTTNELVSGLSDFRENMCLL